MYNSTKNFKNFEDGIKEIATCVPFLKEVIGDATTPQAVVKNMMTAIDGNFPSLDNPEFPAVQALSISANQVGFKTKGSTGFGWSADADENGDITYKFRVTVRGVVATPEEKVLRENGWHQEEPKAGFGFKGKKNKTQKNNHKAKNTIGEAIGEKKINQIKQAVSDNAPAQGEQQAATEG